MLDRLPKLREERLSRLQDLIEKERSPRNKSGRFSSSLSHCLRFLGICDYILDGNIASFRERLSESVAVRMRLLVRYDKGEDISPSFVTMINYQTLLSALAAADFALASDFANMLGNRNNIEHEYDHELDLTLGYSLRAAVLREKSELREMLMKLGNVVGKKGNSSFIGYFAVLNSLLNEDSSEMTDGFNKLEEGYRYLCRPNQIFHETVDMLLPIWPLGLYNLCVYLGCKPTIKPMFLPGNLCFEGLLME